MVFIEAIANSIDAGASKIDVKKTWSNPYNYEHR